MKNAPQTRLLFLLFSVLVPLVLAAQTTPKDTSVLLTLQEDKAYLSFDKPYYTAGEWVYFKAFLADAITHKPDTFATVLYVDVTELATNRVIAQQKLKIEQGSASGSLHTEGVKGGVFFHAYTRWMGNVAADFHFNKSVQVFEPKDAFALEIGKKDAKKKVVLPAVKLDVPEVNNASASAANAAVDGRGANKTSLQFFPEGGNLLTGFANRIAFKAVDATGRGVAVKGVVRNEKGEELVLFQDDFIGMGRFNLVVKKGEKYTAFVKNADGSDAVFPLPTAQNNVATMLVDNINNTNDLRVVFYFSYDSLTMPNAFRIVAHQRGKLCFSNTLTVKNKQTLRTLKLLIPRAAFTEAGIATVTLFEESGKAIAERLTFIAHKKRALNINVTTEKAVFDKRERVTVNVETSTTDGAPVAADVSFSVTNESKIGTPQYAEDLRTYLLLRSDLRGHIEQPRFYFEDTTAKARLALDNLLMTQGWRRFNWNEKRDNVDFKSENGMSVEVVVRRKKAPVADASCVVFLTRSDNRTQSAFAQTNDRGRILLEGLDFSDSAQLYFNVTNSAKTYTVEQELPRRIPAVAEPQMFTPDAFADNLNAYLDAAQAVLLGQKLRTEKEILLQEIVVKARKKDVFDDDARINRGFVDRSYVIDPNERGSLLNYLESKFIKVDRTPEGDVVLRHNRGVGGGVYGLVIDGFGQPDGFILNNYQMDDVERVDIVNNGNGGYIVSSMSAPSSSGGFGELGGRTDGVVHILTKSGDPNYRKKYGKSLDSDVPKLNLRGYAVQKQFYTPNYAVSKPEYAEADRRTTLFWSPTIRTDAQGKASVSFYTTDDAQVAKIMVEGLDGAGRVGVKEARFKVN